MEKELVAAAGKGNGTRIALLLATKTDVNCRSGLRQFTPLCKAAEQGHCPVVEQLLAAGADPALTDSRGRMALDIARSKEYHDIAALLEEAMGLADPSLAADKDGSFDIASAPSNGSGEGSEVEQHSRAGSAGAAGAAAEEGGDGSGSFGFSLDKPGLAFQRPAAVGEGVPPAAMGDAPAGGRFATPASVGGNTHFGRVGFNSAAFASLMSESTAAARQAGRAAAAEQTALRAASAAAAPPTPAQPDVAGAADLASSVGSGGGGSGESDRGTGTAAGGTASPNCSWPASPSGSVGGSGGGGGDYRFYADAERRSVSAEKRACSAEERAARAEERAARAEERAARAEERATRAEERLLKLMADG